MIFTQTIRENISLGDPNVTQEQIEQAAIMANAHNFINEFPDGYETKVGDLGGQLSGGQKQRIAIARILCKNPRILLLDEATSALDSESEATVQKALDRLMQLRHVTTLIVAHRLSTVKKADLICVMSQGKIVERGTHNDLLTKKGYYYDLVQAQRTKESKSVRKGLNSRQEKAGDRRVSYVDLSVFKQDANRTPLIQFLDVHFRYPARKDVAVLRGMNLTVYHGETLAVVGPSGSGKSTIVSLLECFYRPNRGEYLSMLGLMTSGGSHFNDSKQDLCY